MSVAPLTWSFVGTMMNQTAGNNSFQHYTWFVFVKKLEITPGAITVS